MNMRNNRRIIHMDLDAFYCAVEELFNPKLHSKPFAVGGSPDKRGVVTSCSYSARKFGVRSAMPAVKAIQLCPELIFLQGRRKEYNSKSREVMEVLRRFTSKLEQISIDEAFLDLSDYSKDIFKLAKFIRKSIFKSTSLPCSLGIATNKLVAKIATDFGKTRVNTNTYPNAIQAIPFGKEAEFLAPLPTEILWGVGPKTANELNNLGIDSIGELAKWPKDDLISRFGQYGYVLSLRANGIDNREVTTKRSAKSFSQEITFSKNVNDENKLKHQIEQQCIFISKRLKSANLLGSVVKIKLRWPDFTTITRQTTNPKSTSEANEIFKIAFDLFLNNWNKNHPVRLLGVGISGLHPPERQLSLWDKTNYEKVARIEKALLAVRKKFGEEALSKGIINDKSSG